MGIHGGIILRKIFKKVDLLCNIREHFNSCLDQIRNLFQVQIFLHSFPNDRKSIFIIGFIFHRLNVLAIHPAKFHHIKYRRRFADPCKVKRIDQLLKAEYLPVIRRAPAQQCYKIHDRLR